MYRVTVTDAQSTDRDQILLVCSIEQSVYGTVWIALEGAPTSLTLPFSAVRGALRVPGGPAEKRSALIELIRKTTRSLPALYGAVAVNKIEELLPTGWPVTVNL